MTASVDVGLVRLVLLKTCAAQCCLLVVGRDRASAVLADKEYIVNRSLERASQLIRRCRCDIIAVSQSVLSVSVHVFVECIACVQNVLFGTRACYILFLIFNVQCLGKNINK